MNQLTLAHDLHYLQSSKKEIEVGLPSLSTGDTAISKQTWKVASKVTGGVLNAVDQIVEGKRNHAFCITRPPGHHANRKKGMGFCLFNHVAIAARYAQKKHGVGNVLIVDWDVHHGNGTQDIFYEDDSVYFFSTHQSPWYPGTGNRTETGKGIGLGYTLNYPLSAGAGKKEIVDFAFGSKLIQKMVKFKPELILISAGFDSRINDPLGQFQLQDQDFFELTSIILEIAREYANNRVISVLEGGYNLDGLASASVSHLQAFLQKNQ
jgi:acetoin utilization deacetylase AcuC-like enzyme